MTTLSPLTSSLLQMLGAGGGSSSGTANAAVASVLGQVQAAKGAGATTAEALRQTLVTLSSQNGTANSSSVQTYNAKGLLNQVQASLQKNPLFATDASADPNASDSSLGTVLGGSMNTGGVSSTFGAAPSPELMQLFKQSPSLAAAYVQGQVTTSIFDNIA